MLGWEAPVYRLAQAGWEFRLVEDHSRHTFRVALHHRPMSLYSLSNSLIQSRLTDGTVEHITINHLVTDIIREAVFVDRESVANEASLTELSTNNPAQRFTERFSELNLFGERDVPSTLVDLADMTIVDHLKAIKDKQQSRQAELRERARRTSRFEETRIIGLVA